MLSDRNEVFWDEKSGFYAYALDGDKKKVLSVTSNVGQCLWSGIIAPKRAATVVKRLMQKDMWSGWEVLRGKRSAVERKAASAHVFFAG
jgi:glycogen debranching enzyme